MATLLTTLPDSALTMRYREPYLSKSLNAKFQTVVSPGIYDGLEIAVNPVLPGYITISPGTASVTSGLLNSADYQVTVQQDGVISVNLSSFTPGATVAIVLEAFYQVQTVTTAQYSGYVVGIDTIPSTACVLGQVTIPSPVTALAASDLSLSGRTYAWGSRGRDAVPMLSVVKNGRFSVAVPPDLPAYWFAIPGAAGDFVTDTSPSGAGTVLVAAATTTGIQSAIVRQNSGTFIPAGRGRVRVAVSFTVTQTPTGVGTPILNVTFADIISGVGLYSLQLPLAGPVGAPTTVEKSFALDAQFPMPGNGVVLNFVEISFNGATYSAASEAFRVSSVVVEIESASAASDLLLEQEGEKRVSQLTLVGTSVNATLVSVGDVVVLGGSATLALSVPRLLTTSLDSLSTLEIGTSTQTMLQIGRNGVLGSPTFIRGTGIQILNDSGSGTSDIVLGGAEVTISAALKVALNSRLDIVGNNNPASVVLMVKGASGQSADLQQWQTDGGVALAKVTATGNLLVAASLDRESAGVLALGETNASGVTLAKSGANTDVLGPLRVDSTIDRLTAGSLTIAGTTATILTLGGASLGQLDLGVGTPTTTRVINIGTGSTSATSAIIINIGTGSNDPGAITIGNGTRSLSLNGSTAVSRDLTVTNGGAHSNTVLTVAAGSNTQTGALQKWRAWPSWSSSAIRDVASLSPDGVFLCTGLDEIEANPLEIGGTTATEVLIGRAAINTSVLGTLLVQPGSPTGGGVQQKTGAVLYLGTNGTGHTVSIVGSLGVAKRAVFQNTDMPTSPVVGVDALATQSVNIQEWRKSGVQSFIDSDGAYGSIRPYRSWRTLSDTLPTYLPNGDFILCLCTETLNFGLGYSGYPAVTNYVTSGRQKISLDSITNKRITGLKANSRYKATVTLSGNASGFTGTADFRFQLAVYGSGTITVIGTGLAERQYSGVSSGDIVTGSLPPWGFYVDSDTTVIGVQVRSSSGAGAISNGGTYPVFSLEIVNLYDG